MNPELPAKLEEVINKALEKDRNLRYQSASDMRTDLKRLKRDTESGLSPEVAAASQELTERSRKARGRWKILVPVGVLVAVAAVLGWRALRPTPVAKAQQTTIAVLPFQNLGGDTSLDFLGLALPDEAVTTLSYIPSLAVRPFENSRKYAGNNVDPQVAGRELRVTDLVTGDYGREGGQLRVTLEVIDVENNRVVWRDSVNAAPDNMIAVREQMAARLRQGLAPVLGLAGGAESASKPRNPEAYELYLRAVALTRDAAPNKQAIELLEKSVALDGSYAPAWQELGFRYYFDTTYGGGDASEFQRSDAARSRALALDPGNILASEASVILPTEKGDLTRAYDEAKAFLQRRPDSANAHFAMAYLLRYAGVLDESAQECDRALTLDPTSREPRSCARTFELLGNYGREQDFLRLDAGSEFSRDMEADSALRRGDLQQAVEKTPSNVEFKRRALAAFAAGRKQEVSAIVRETLPGMLARRDSEQKFWFAGWVAYVGEGEAALQLVRKAVEQNYCAALEAEKDLLYANLRGSPEFAQLMNQARQCREKFIEHRKAAGK